MQEREFPTVLRATYLTTGHLRQHPLHFFRVTRADSWTDVVGVIDLLWSGDPDPAALIESCKTYAGLTHIVLPRLEDAAEVMEWAGGAFSKSVNAVCHVGNSVAQIARVVGAFAEFVPVVVPMADPEDVSASDPLFVDQTEGVLTGGESVARARADESSKSTVRAGGCRIVKCRVAKSEQPLSSLRAAGLPLPPEDDGSGAAHLSSAVAGVGFRESFAPQSMATQMRLLREVTELENSLNIPAPVFAQGPSDPRPGN